MGDSHAEVFRAKVFQRGIEKYFFEVHSIVGATASGLNNPNSKTHAGPIFRKLIKETKAGRIFILLGEVDTGFVIWYRAQSTGESVEEMSDKALRSYQLLIDEAACKHKVCVISAPLPTIGDGIVWGDVANARREVKATQIERTKLTIEFNREMKKFCARRGFDYIDVDRESINEDGIVDKRLLNSDLKDHHYDRAAYVDLLLPKVKGVLSVEAGFNKAI